MKNPFESPDKNREQTSKERRERALEHAKEMTLIARKCLDHEEFKKYREMFIKLERVIIDDLIDYREADAIRYAMTVSNMLSELRQMRTFLNQVERDAKRSNEI